ncbi:MAG: three-Cys-motif partner protein TcmP [Nitrospiraceae bacterium]|nr:three-Cys-motif partner protein TcmP [Nitrospiraceae bacterium]
MSNGDLYAGREQTLVKHFILRNYLERFAIIVGSRWDTLTYVDCFSGPWKVRSEEFKDSSFAIALEQLSKARKIHKERTGRTLKLRCFFLEKAPSAYTKLKQFADQIDGVTIETKNKKLENAIQDILKFVQDGGPTSFPFIFIDPTGWSGFALETITPLLKLNPGEVLINFMTDYIRRFIEWPQRQNQESFIKLFGSSQFKDILKGLEEKDREDAIVTAYSECVKRVGAFGYTSSAIVLHPEKNRTHFHLIYATRDLKGIKVFKDAEKKAMPVMEKTRDEAQKRDREERTGQTELGLFSGTVTQDPSAYFRFLRERYMSRARATVLDLVQGKKQLTYDEAWSSALTFPLTWESDLKDWIREWEQDGQLEIIGMKERQHVPQLGENIRLVWKGSRASSSRG